MIDRRQFLLQSGLVSLTPWIPTFLSRSLAADESRADDRILVIIQLDGGNDGLNTVIPFADENYAKFRRELRIAEKNILKINDSIGLHPSLKSVRKMFDDREFAIVQGVGYPNPDRSHFESMAIWHHAQLDSATHSGGGWLGRAASAISAGSKSSTDSYFIGGAAIPAALVGRRANAAALEQESDLTLLNPGDQTGIAASAGELAAFVTRSQSQSYEAAKRLRESNLKAQSGGAYPATKLADHLQMVARMIKLEFGTRVFYTAQDGYDTHSVQADSHRQLLSEFSGAVGAFLADLKESKLADRVLVLAFSEFGRRVQENGSAGTDHGAAGPVFLAGTGLQGGLTGEHPSLTDLDDGDLKMSIDFRRIYASVLTDWLKIDATPILGEAFPPLKLFQT